MNAKLLVFVIAGIFLASCATLSIKPVKKFNSAYAICKMDSEKEKYLEKAINKELEKREIFGESLLVKCQISHSDTIKIDLFDSQNIRAGGFELKAGMSLGIFAGGDESIFDFASLQIINHIEKNYIKKEKK